MPANPPRAPGELAEIEAIIRKHVRCQWSGEPFEGVTFVILGQAEAAAEIAALRAPQGDGAEAKEWLPITTAPKDGTTIVLGFYDIDDAGERDWFTPEGNFVDGYMPAGWYEHEYVTQVQPTHWVPKLKLPPPPAQGTEAEGRNTEGGSVHEGPVGEADAPSPHPDTLTKAGGPSDA